MHKRLSMDLLFAAAMAVVPRVGAGRMEAGRLLILACVYASVALLAHFRMMPPRAYRSAQLAFAATLLLLGWLMSFPAWNHSGEIGLYILFGAMALVAATWRHAVRSVSQA